MLAIKFFSKQENKIFGAYQGSFEYKLGEWMHVNNVKMCDSGFHLPRRIRDVEEYGNWFDSTLFNNTPYLVDVKGECIISLDDDKFVVSDIKLIKELPTFNKFEGRTKRDRIRGFIKWVHLNYPDLYYYDRGWKSKYIKNCTIIK